MSITTLQTTAHDALSTRFANRVFVLFSSIREYLRIRRAAAALHDLSPEMLKDLGIDRSEIERVAKFGRRGS
ncbi:DUF1127 domain-containing protein [Phreatobacter sp. HK31-P]